MNKAAVDQLKRPSNESTHYESSNLSSNIAQGGEKPDPRLIYYSPKAMEMLRNSAVLVSPPKDYAPLKKFEHLKSVHFDLERAKLTDKQMIAISLVFYGRLRKNYAAKVMNIAKQSLDSHLKLALQKIERYLSG